VARDETYEVYSAPCPCGKGNLSVTVTRADHMYAKARALPNINCLTCAALYNFKYGRDYQYLTLKSEQQKQSLAARSCVAIHGEIHAALVSRIAAVAHERGRTKAHWHVALAPLLGEKRVGTLDEFKLCVRRARNLRAWISDNVRRESFEPLCQALSAHDLLPRLSELVRAEQERQRCAVRQIPLPPPALLRTPF
jgi:hypothetical protein